MRLKGTAFPGGFKAAKTIKRAEHPTSTLRQSERATKLWARRREFEIVGTRRRMSKRARAAASRIESPGAMVMKDWAPSGRRMSGLLIGRVGPQGGISSNPAHQVAWYIRKGLSRPRQPDVTVYDKDGKPIAIIDGESRERRSL